MTTQFTAKVFIAGHEDIGDGQTRLIFGADYADGRNKEWAKYTPAFALNMVVLDEVAQGLKWGDRATLTFDFSQEEPSEPSDTDG